MASSQITLQGNVSSNALTDTSASPKTERVNAPALWPTPISPTPRLTSAFRSARRAAPTTPTATGRPAPA